MNKTDVVVSYINGQGKQNSFTAGMIADKRGYINHQMVFEFAHFRDHPTRIHYSPTLLALDGKGTYVTN